MINDEISLDDLVNLVIKENQFEDFKVYKNLNKGLKFKENDELGGDDLYSESKSSADIISQAYIKSFFIRWLWIRWIFKRLLANYNR